MLHSQYPMWVGWGASDIFLYNDACVSLLGPAKHPWVLGRPASEVLAEIWDLCVPLSDRVLKEGRASSVDDQRLFIIRQGGVLEEMFYSFSYSPICDESGHITGLFCLASDVTAKNLHARRQATISEITSRALLEKSVEGVCVSAANAMDKNRDDIPFACLYWIEDHDAVRVQTTGLPQSLCPDIVSLTSSNASNLPFVHMYNGSTWEVVNLEGGAGLPLGPMDQSVRQAVMLSILAPGHKRPLAILVAGVSPTRRLDVDYRNFYEQVAHQIAIAIENARSIEEQRRRLKSLIQLDRSLFESNNEGFCVIQVLFDEQDQPVDYVFLQVNRVFEEQTGVLHAKGRRMREIAPDHEKYWFELFGNIAKTGEPRRFEYPALQIDRWLEGYAFRIGEVAECKVGIIFNDITKRKQVMEEICRTNDLLSEIVNRAPVGIAFLDLDLRFLRINQRLADINGLLVDQHVGKRVEDIFPFLGAMVKQIAAHILETGQAVENVEVSGQTPREPGQMRFWNESWYPVHDAGHEIIGFGAIVEEITERKQWQDRVLASEERLRLAMASSDMGAWDIDLVTQAVVWDVRQYEIFGVSVDQSPASMDQFYALLHPEDVQRVKEAAARALVTGRFNEQFRVVLPSKMVRWVSSHGATILSNGRPVRMIGVNYDITDRKLAEMTMVDFTQELELQVASRTADLEQSQESLRALATELNLAEQRERKRLAGELHDHFAQLLVLARLKLQQAKCGPVSEVLKQIGKVEKVLDDTLAYTRQLVSELCPPILYEFGLVAALQWLGEEMKRYELQVTVLIETTAITMPENQAVLLFQSVREILINVAKHAMVREATLTVVCQDGMLEIIVRDKGVGFDSAVKTSSTFGLFSIRERMKALGGRFEIHSVPGEGTTATLLMPHEEKQSLPTLASKKCESQEFPVITTGEAIRVLLVDDHAMIRQGLRSVLERYPDVKVIAEATNGAQAVQLTNQLQPTVVIMDINMPIMNGIEATAIIKSRQPQIAVIGMSVNASSQNNDAMRKAGASVLLSKESAVEQLYNSIKNVVKTVPFSAGLSSIGLSEDNMDHPA